MPPEGVLRGVLGSFPEPSPDLSTGLVAGVLLSTEEPAWGERRGCPGLFLAAAPPGVASERGAPVALLREGPVGPVQNRHHNMMKASLAISNYHHKAANST